MEDTGTKQDRVVTLRQGPDGRFLPGNKSGGRPKSALILPDRRAAEHVARKLISDKQYVAEVRKRLRAGTAERIEELLWHYAYGQPRNAAEPVQVTMAGQRIDWSLESTEDLLLLRGVARRIRAAILAAPREGAPP